MRLAVAIPGSSLSDESLKADKTRKASVLARACAIFGVEVIFVYGEGGGRGDGALLSMMLRYLDTPQFLRRRLFPKVNDLKYAGVMHPLRIPSHSTPADPAKIKSGDVREGVVVSARGKKFVDVGINRLVPFRGGIPPGRRVTVRFKVNPGLSVTEIDRGEAGIYWGYVVRERAGLHQVLSEWRGGVIITSRKGRPVTPGQIAKYTQSEHGTLVVFGSPERGVAEILGARTKNLQNAKTLNFFPRQTTQTVRLEEAVMGALSIISLHGGAGDGRT